MLGHPFNCLSTSTPASCPSPAPGHRHSGCLGSGRSRVHLLFPLFCCKMQRLSTGDSQCQRMVPAGSWGQSGLARGAAGDWGGPGETVLLVFLTPRLARSLPELGAQGSGVLPVLPAGLWEGDVKPQNWPPFLRIVSGPQGGTQAQPSWPEPVRLWEGSEPGWEGSLGLLPSGTGKCQGGSRENPGKGQTLRETG